jgi:cytochrome c peroxidase
MIRLAFLFLLAASPAFAQSPRQALMAELAAAAKAENPAFAGFSSERGKALYMTPNSGGKPETPSCSACHSDKPNAEGRNVRTFRRWPFQSMPNVSPTARRRKNGLAAIVRKCSVAIAPPQKKAISPLG